GHDRAQIDDLNGRCHPVRWAGVKVAIAQFARNAFAPGPDCTIGLERQAVVNAGRNRHDAAQTTDLNRRSRSDRVKVAIAQLALDALTPSPYCTVGLERQALVLAASNRRDHSQTAYLNR